MAGPGPAAAQSVTDYDADDNGLIEVRTLVQLNAMRYDLDGNGDPASATTYNAAFPNRDTATTTRMGCPAGNCAGYELLTDLTFPTTGQHAAWTPIGGPFNTTFDGNGHTLTGMTVNATSGHAGLFGILGTSGVIRDAGMINPTVRTTAGAGEGAGALAGRIESGGQVSASYVQGGSITLAANNASGGGLAGINAGAIRASYATAEVRTDGPQIGAAVGGLVGWLNGGAITASYAAGAVAGSGSGASAGGLVGFASGNIADSYCDLQASMRPGCIGDQSGLTGTADGKTAEELKTPTGYTGIYENWNLDLDGDSNPDDPWQFGGPKHYPVLWHQPAPVIDSPPPSGPKAQPPQETPYDPAADHPEIYENERYGMAVTCEVQPGADGGAESALIRFDLGRYDGEVILHLSIWNGDAFYSYESQDIAMPPLEREGRMARVRVSTDLAQTRFRLDSVSPTTNLVLGYADCHTDD